MDAIEMPGLHWITGPTFRQIKSIVWTRLKAILKNFEDSKNWTFNEAELYAEHKIIRDAQNIPTRIELKGVDKEDSLVGVGLRSLRCDEAALYRPHVWPQILRPMLVDHEAPCTFFSTPRGKNWLYELWLKGQDPNEEDWMSWQYPSSVNKYLPPNEIETMRREMSERLFRQEVMGEFLDDETGVFKGVRRCTVGDLSAPIAGRFYVMGIDLAKTIDFTVLTVIDSVTREVVAFERFNQIEWREQRARIQNLARKYNNALCLIDSTGVGDPIFEELRDTGVSIEGFKFNNTSKLQLIDQLAIAIENRAITWPRELEFITQELLDFEYTLTNMGNIRYGAPEGKHDDCVISLALAVWLIRSQLNQAQVVSKAIEEQEMHDRQGQGTPVKNDYGKSNLMTSRGY